MGPELYIPIIFGCICFLNCLVEIYKSFVRHTHNRNRHAGTVVIIPYAGAYQRIGEDSISERREGEP